ncbi:MAG: tetratricopeptide repeat protein, partial [Anaerolineae bacterium]|nr:tetratricopeptide repeat protein [Anaerolineae bacterium]
MADYISHEAPSFEAAALPVTVPPKLIGRDAVLGQVYTRLRENKPVLIYGAAGVGKTALAATLAAAYTEQPGGVLWFHVNDATIDQLIVRVGRAYDVTEIASSEHPMGMFGAVASTLNQHKPLIVLDGRLNEEVTRVFVERCADKLPILLLNQQAFGEDQWTTIQLEPLEAAPASALIKQAAGLPAADNPEIDQLAQTLRHMPMALVLAGATLRATKQTPDQYRAALMQIPGYANADPSLVALTTAFRSLNSALQGLLLMMGAMFDGEASAALLSEVGNAPQATIEQAMRILAHQNLVELTTRYDMPYYRLHPLTHKFAQTLAGEKRLADLQSKISDALLKDVQNDSGDADDQSFNRLAAEMDTILAAAAWGVQKNDLTVPNRFAMSLMQADDFIAERGYVYELLKLRRMAATSTSAFPASDISPRPAAAFRAAQVIPPEDEAEDEDEDIEEEEIEEDEDFEDDEEEAAIPAPAFLSELFIDDEDDDLAYDEDDEDEVSEAFIPEIPEPEVETAIPVGDVAALRAALLTARQKGDRDRQIDLLKAMGQAQIDANQENEAIATYTEIVALYEDKDDDRDLLDILDTLTALMVKTENAQPAIMHANRGIQLAEGLGDEDTRMHMYITLADARQQLGESQAAETAYGRALEIARNRGDTQNEAIILYKLGYAQLDNSDAEGASATWEQALRLFREQGKREYEGKVLGGLGSAYGEQERWSEAVRFHTSALHIAREVDDQTEESLQLNNLAYAAVQAEDLAQAVLRYRQALHLAYDRDDREGIVSAIVDLAGLLVRSPRHLAIAQLLIEDAAALEPYDRDVNNLRQRITGELSMQQAQGIA